MSITVVSGSRSHEVALCSPKPWKLPSEKDKESER